MKLGPVTKIDKRNTVTSKKFDDDVILAMCEVIVIFTIYGKFGAIRKLDSGDMVCKKGIVYMVTFYFTKTENRTKKPLTQLSYYCFELRYCF